MDEQDIINRATALERIAKDEHFQAVVKGLRDEFINGIVTSKADEIEARERCKVMIDVLQLIENRIAGNIQSGKLSASRRGLTNLFRN